MYSSLDEFFAYLICIQFDVAATFILKVGGKIGMIPFICAPILRQRCRGGLQWLRPYSAPMGWKR